MSLANVLAVTQAAHSIVLLGDPHSSNSRKRERILRESDCLRYSTCSAPT
jgi:hypothetical protein